MWRRVDGIRWNALKAVPCFMKVRMDLIIRWKRMRYRERKKEKVMGLCEGDNNGSLSLFNGYEKKESIR